VAKEEFDLLQIPAALTAQLGTGSTKVTSAEVLDSDLLQLPPNGPVSKLITEKLLTRFRKRSK
jgi:hypothetical protein